MKKINLSYVITTRNKLPYLKEVLEDLIKNKLGDEEIIINDGASTDGTVQYLNKLFKQHKIDFFSSAQDAGEAHGFNKGILAANGYLIKIITDDDAFYYPGIRKCKEFMLKHQEIDFLNTEGAVTDWSKVNPFFGSYFYKQFKIWQKNRKPFDSTGLGWMIRKNSLPLLGLLATNVIRVDAEYSLRASSIKRVNYAWYTAPCWVRITNSSSNSIVFAKKAENEFLKMEKYYLDKGIGWEIIKFLKNKRDFISAVLGFAKRSFQANNKKSQSYEAGEDSISQLFIKSRKWLVEQNKKGAGKFLN